MRRPYAGHGRPSMDCMSSLGVYPTIDFDFWVKHGSWKMCPCCCSMYFDDKYFREVVYQTVRTTSRADEASCFVGQVPNEPVEHVEGAVENLRTARLCRRQISIRLVRLS